VAHDAIDPEEARLRLLTAMHRDLHDLCQPLTALQCRLELGRMSGGDAYLREALDGGLQETRRIFAIVARMRSCLRQQEAEAMAGPSAQSGSMIV